MNQTQADTLAHKLTTSFARTHIDPTAWADQLKPLDHEQAEKVTTYCIQAYDKQPTIAQFLTEYYRRVNESDVHMSQWKPDPKAISFGQYFAIMQNRAAKGDREAIELVETWEAYLAKQG